MKNYLYKINEFLKQIERTPLSDNDILKGLNPDPIIKKYPELQDNPSMLNSITECVLLFLTVSENNGHWICILNKPNSLEYFDPYGFSVKGEGKKLGLSTEDMDNLDQDSNVMYNNLRNYCNENNKEFIQNTHKYQQSSPNIQTCGRHCVARLYFKDLTLNQYKNLLKHMGMPADTFVSILSHDLGC